MDGAVNMYTWLSQTDIEIIHCSVYIDTYDDTMYVQYNTSQLYVCVKWLFLYSSEFKDSHFSIWTSILMLLSQHPSKIFIFK